MSNKDKKKNKDKDIEVLEQESANLRICPFCKTEARIILDKNKNHGGLYLQHMPSGVCPARMDQYVESIEQAYEWWGVKSEDCQESIFLCEWYDEDDYGPTEWQTAIVKAESAEEAKDKSIQALEKKDVKDLDERYEKFIVKELTEDILSLQIGGWIYS